MARLNTLIAAVTVALLVTACGGKKPQPQEQAVDCSFPDAPTVAAPGWICDQPVSDYPVTAVGSAQKTDAGYDFMKDQAAASARVRLAQQMQVHVMNMVKQYVETTGSGDAETVDQVRTSVSKVITDQTLLGSRIIRNRTSPNGYLYVLVGIDEQNAMYNSQQALRTSMGNDQALWQQFKAEKGYDELAEEITNFRN